MRMSPQATGGYQPAPAGTSSATLGAVFDDLASAGDHAHTTADDIHGQIIKLMTTLDALSPQWAGPARNALYAKWEDLRPAIDALRDSLHDVGDRLDKAHQGFSTMETDNEAGITKSLQI
jgi:WXG100 family type VII secretion target